MFSKKSWKSLINKPFSSWKRFYGFSKDSGQAIKRENLYDIDFYNGGFKVELCYKWVFGYLTDEQSVASINTPDVT